MRCDYVNQKNVINLLVIGILIGSMAISSIPDTVKGEPRQGGSLRVVYGFPMFETNFIIQPWTAASIPFTNMYNRLITRAPDWSVIPELAHSWDIAENGKKYTFYLEKDVRFHDGTLMTSADVKHTFTAAYGYQSAMLENSGLEYIMTPDDYTVVFEFKQSVDWTYFIGVLGDGYIKPKHLYEAPGIDWETLQVWDEPTRKIYEEYSHAQDDFEVGGGPIGTGPFRFVEYVDNEYFHFERFEDYWEEGLPYLDDLYYIIYPIMWPDTYGTSIDHLFALTLGDVDAYHGWAPYFPLEFMDRINESDDYTVDPMGNFGIYRLTFNMNPDSSPKDPYSAKPDEQWVLNKNVRIAMEHAINKEAMVQNIYYNVMPAQYTAIPNFMWAHNDAIEPRTYDKEKAEQMLDDAGYTIQPDGWRLHNVTFKVYQQLSEMGEWIAADLRAVGIEATAFPMNSVLFEEIYEREEGIGGPLWNAMDEYQEAFAVNHQACHSVRTLISWLYTLDESKRGYYNMGHYSNPRVDFLLNKTLETPNPMDQAIILNEIQEIVSDEIPIIFLVPSHRVEAWNNRYVGFNPSNRPLHPYGSYKLVYDNSSLPETTSVTTLFTSVSEISSVAVATVVLGSIGFILSKVKNWRDRRFQ